MTATIIVENGNIVAGANSYISTTNLTTYATNRGITIAGVKEDLLIQAMDYIESLNYIGYKYTPDQALQWPRYDVTMDGYYITVTTIPQLLIDALCETALAIDASNSPLSNVERTEKQVVVGNISVTYDDNAAPTTIVRKISNKLGKLLRSGSAGITFGVARG